MSTVKMRSWSWAIMVLAAAVVMGMSTQAHATFLVATFADPVDQPQSDSDYLVTIDLNNDLITAGWGDETMATTGLTLEVPLLGEIVEDAWFEMTPLTYTDSDFVGITSNAEPGVLTFYRNQETTPLMTITFDQAQVHGGIGMGADELLSLNQVTIAVDGYAGPLQEEEFSFAFANRQVADGVLKATAAFTSSAVPEPATLAFLGGGLLVLCRRRRHHG